MKVNSIKENCRSVGKLIIKTDVRRITGTIGVTTLLVCTPVIAQDQKIDIDDTTITNTSETNSIAQPEAELQALRDQLQAVLRRIDQLEEGQTRTADEVKAATQSTVKAKFPISISALLQTQYNAFLQDDRVTVPHSNANGFRMRRAEIKLQAQITDRLGATVMFDPAASTNGRNLQDLKLSYQVRNDRDSTSTLDIGQFKIPIGYEGDLVSSSALKTVERALFYRNGDPIGGRGFDQRDQGIMYSSNQGSLSYWLGVFDGLGENQNKSGSLSDNLALVGRIAYAPRDSGLILGVSGATSNPRNATPASAAAGAMTRVNRNLLNLFTVYRKNRTTAQIEYAMGKSLVAAAPGIPAVSVNRRGYYGSISYRFAKKWEGVLRYDSFDPDTNTSNNALSETTLGLDYYIKGNNAKVQLNLVKVADERPNRNSTQLRSNFQLAF